MNRIKNKLVQIERIRNLKRKIILQEKRDDMICCGNQSYGGFNVADSVVRECNKPVIYSFGIGEDLSFSQDALRRWNCDVYAFDPTPKAIDYVKKHPLYENERFHFYEWGLSDENEIGEFHLPTDESYVSGSLLSHSGVKKESIKVQLKTLNAIMNELGHDKISVLKMDIEGTEFSIFEKLQLEELSFSQLCLEVHDRFFKKGRQQLISLVEKLNQGGFWIISISPNYEEFTFMRR